MVQIVEATSRSRYSARLDGMYRDRKRVFIDWLKWNIASEDGLREIDQFDMDGAIYLIETGEADKHLASIRLLPSVRPHLLTEVFSSLCDGPIPRGSHVWELTRFCVSPDVSKPDAVRLMNLMWTSVVEFAVARDIRQYTCVTHMAFLSQILTAGWDTRPLGLPQVFDGGMIGAVLFNINPDTLQEARRRYGYSCSVFETRHSEAA
jgi:N-acyl-L-homoserine lactone synthetase